MKMPKAISLSRAASLPPPRRFMKRAREIGDHEQAEDPRGEAHVDLHVAVEDVTELVADHGLQLVAIECVERALRHRHRGFVGRMPGRECVDAGLIGQHEDLRLADARRDGHLLDDVQQALALEVAVVAVTCTPPSERATAGPPARNLRASCQRREQDGRRARRPRSRPRYSGFLRSTCGRIAAEADDDHEVDDHARPAAWRQ